jgi:hypothetical protein
MYFKEYPLSSNNTGSNMSLNTRPAKGFMCDLVLACTSCFKATTPANDNCNSSNRANTNAKNKRVYKFKHIKAMSPESESTTTNAESKPLTNPTLYHQQQQTNSSPFSSHLKATTSLTVGKRNTIDNSSQNIYSSTGYLSNQKQVQQAQSSAASRRLTIMLLMVSMTFFITSTPIVTLQTVEQAKLVAPFHYLYIVRGVFLALQYLNHSVNFFLYAVTGKTFRREFFALFKPCKSLVAGRSNNSNANKNSSNNNLKNTTSTSTGMVHSRSNQNARILASNSNAMLSSSRSANSNIQSHGYSAVRTNSNLNNLAAGGNNTRLVDNDMS